MDDREHKNRKDGEEKMLRIDMNVVFTIINLIIFFLLIKRFLFKPILRIMDERRQMIEGQFAEAKKTQEQAIDLKGEYEDALTGAKEESVHILEEARTRAGKEAAQIVSDAEKRAQKIVEQTNANLDNERERALQEVQSQIASLAVTAAVKIIGETNDEKANQEMYNKFLTKAGEANDANS